MIAFHPMPGNAAMAEQLVDLLADGQATQQRALEVHHFPDGENLVRVAPPTPDTEAVIVCSLDRPDTKTVPLLMAAATLRELGARRIGLVAPYLAYMRQDKRFQPGQAVSVRPYAALLSSHFDWMVTVDPHLHRIDCLDEVYALRSRVVHAAPALSDWIRAQVDIPLIVGPDGESAQWAHDVAERVGAPSVVLQKQRFGDRDVRVTVPDLERYPDHTPVLIDDIISSGRTLVAALEHLRAAGSPPPVCAAVHGLLAGDALQAIQAAGAARVACTNTVGHDVETIDVTHLIADGVRELLAPRPIKEKERRA